MEDMRARFQALTDEELERYMKELKDFRPDYQQLLIEEHNRRKSKNSAASGPGSQVSGQQSDPGSYYPEGNMNPYKSSFLRGFLLFVGIVEIVAGLIAGLVSLNIAIAVAGFVGGMITIAIAKIVEKLDLLIALGLREE